MCAETLLLYLIVFIDWNISGCSFTASVGVDLAQEKPLQEMGLPKLVMKGSARKKPMPFIA